MHTNLKYNGFAVKTLKQFSNYDDTKVINLNTQLHWKRMLSIRN